MKTKQEQLEQDTEKKMDSEHQNVVQYEKRKLRTVASLCMFLALGMAKSIHGPMMVNMRELLQTDTVHISMALSFIHGGFLVAAILCGIVFKRINSELQFILAGLVLSLSLTFAPWSRDIYGYIVACAVCGFGKGYIDTGSNAYILMLWSGDRAKVPVMQVLHLVWSIGTFLSPLLVKPFLVEAIHGTSDPWNRTMHLQNRTVTDDDLDINSDPFSKNVESNLGLKAWNHNETLRDDNLSGLTRKYNVLEYDGNSSVSNNISYDGERDITVIRYAYLLVGGVVFLSVLIFIAVHCLLRHPLIPKSRTSSSTQTHSERTVQPTRSFKAVFYGLVVIFFFVFSNAEGVVPSYFPLFVVSSLGWTVHQGATVSAVFWGGIGVGRLIGVPTSFILGPRLMLSAGFLLNFAGCLMLVFVRAMGDAAAYVYVSVAVIGLGLSTIFPSMLLWISDILGSASKVSAVAMTSAHIGAMLGYTIIGALMEAYSPIVLVYLAVLLSVLLMVLFVSMFISTKRASSSKQIVIETEMQPINPFEESQNHTKT